MKFSTATFALLATLGLTNAQCGGFDKVTFADMGDGDEKIVSVEGLTLTLSQTEPLWNLTATLDDTDCTASIDFSKSDKPGYPPVPIIAHLLDTSVGTMEIEFTDNTGELNEDPTYPLNVWATVDPLGNDEKCATFDATNFQDLHDGDVKSVSVSSTGELKMGQEGIWDLTTSVDPVTCQATIDFSLTTKPDQPPVPLIATVVVAKGRDPLEARTQLVFTDPSGQLNPDSAYPLNIWEAV